MHNNLTKKYTADISIILPCMNDSHLLVSQLSAIKNQTIKPQELILIDSSSDDIIENICKEHTQDLNIQYLRAGRASKFDRYKKYFLKILGFKKKALKLQSKLYPSEATNVGAEKAKGDILAFLDMATVPKDNWLEGSYHLIESGHDVVFGSTKYESQSITQQRIHFSTFGNIAHETNPGTLIKRHTYLQNKLIEGYRAGVDLEWRERIKNNIPSHISPKDINLKYQSLPNSFRKFVWKMFLYQIHSVPLQIQQNTKIFMGIILLFLVSLVLIRWNYLVGWNSPFYLPHIAKITLLTFNLFFILLIFSRRIGARILKKFNTPLTDLLGKITLLASVFFISYHWNEDVAGWLESSRYYIPHLTKFSILAFLLALITYRGVFFPLKNGIYKEEIFPFKFLGVGLYGAISDLAKIPGFFLGALIYPFFKYKK